ncbi:MAG TPA: ATP-binding protein [Kofleriaceae bacterium]|nr:ATP-binding protein [Kofleriaceae bacterium]
MSAPLVRIDPAALVAALVGLGIDIEIVDGEGRVLAAGRGHTGHEPLRVVCEVDSADERHHLVQASRMAAIGQLAAGMAHEINNPTAYSMLNLTFALEQVEQLIRAGRAGTELRDLIREALNGLDRIKAITRDLRLFSRVERDEEGPVDLADLVRTTCRMLDHEIRLRARLRLFLTPLPLIRADGAKLGIVLSNLLTNSLQAIEPGQADRNDISVSTRLEGDEVVIIVVDTGCGIAEELQDRVFDPFFTTRGKGADGTGMGLAQCAELVRRHGGTIRLSSGVGRGTRVEIRMPLRPAMPPAPAESAPAVPIDRRLRVLVVDDDPMVLRAYTRVLSGAFDLVLAEGGVEALDVVARDRGFDVVLCDLMMPVVDGVTFFERAAEVIPDLERRIVFCTGGAFSERTKEFIAERKVRAVDKPIDAATLRRTLEEVAAAAGPPAPPTEPAG